MVTRKPFVGATLISAAALAAAAPGFTQARTAWPAAEALTPGEKAANAALLAKLMERRAQIAGSAIAEEDKRHALEFLDRQIAKANGQSGS